MNFQFSSVAAEKVKASLLVVGIPDAKIKKGSTLARLDKKMKGAIAKILKQEAFKAEVGSAKLIHSHGLIPSDALLILGTKSKTKGDLAPNDLELLRRAAALAARTAQKNKAKTLAFDLESWPCKDFETHQQIKAAVEGMKLASYKFNVYRKVDRKERASLNAVTLLTEGTGSATRRGLKIGRAIAEGIALARDLVNTPAGDMSPTALARQARRVGPGIQVRIYSRQEITRMKMGAFLAVSQGSTQPPTLIHMRYRPTGRAKKTIAIVGKGVTFDSGGLSLKPPSSMTTMKDDMAGSAAVLGLMRTLSQIRPSVAVHGIVAATENMPSGSAVKPGDVARAMNGKTIEILNTDAEGRLTLADALHFAIKKKPDLVIDLATLTGACLIALGERCAGLMGNDKALLESIEVAAATSGEMVWRLPLIDEYKEDLKSPIADLKNIGGRWGGTIEAGLFLREFVGDTPWAHIDIAGSSWTDKDLAYSSRGGTGSMVSTLTQLILDL